MTESEENQHSSPKKKQKKHLKGARTMKVYELMKALEEMRAGKDVVVRSLIEVERANDCLLIDDLDGKGYYGVVTKVKEIETDREDNVILYAE